MAQAKQKNIALSGMDLSVDEGYIPDDVARFIKGWTYLLSDNGNVPGADLDGGQDIGANKFVFVTNKSNEEFKASIQLPYGDNRSIGGGFIYETGKYYSMLWNSQNNHSIWELDGNTRQVRKVIENACLGFRYEPEHFINITRFTYSIYSYFDKYSNTEKTKTWIFIVDDYNDNRQINVEDAIATNGFTHSFFNSNGADCCDVCLMISVGIPRPNGCIGITPVTRPDTPEEKAKPNVMNSRIWQWRIRWIDAWGREGEHGIISKEYFNSTNNSCANNEDLYPRCVDLNFEAGCPYIVGYDIAFRTCSSGNNELIGDSDWKRCDRVFRYSDCDASGNFIPNFWNRSIKTQWSLPISETNGVHYDPASNTITYRFCGNRDSASIPKLETDRTQNYLPIKSGSVFKLENKIGFADNTRGFEPLSCSELDKIKFGVQVVQDSGCNPFVKRKITVYGYYYNPIDGVVTNVRKTYEGGNVPCVSYGRAGQQNGGFSSSKDNNNHYKQAFKVGTVGLDNLVMYLANTNYYAVGVQGTIASGTFVPVGVMTDLSEDTNIVTRWEFYDVPAGIFIGRFSAPGAGVSTGYKETSANFIAMTKPGNVGTFVNGQQHEILIDVRTSDYDSFAQTIPQAAMIWDLTSYVSNATAGNLANAITGYAEGNNGTKYIRLEKAPIIVGGSPPSTTMHKSDLTDHNGYYFATTKGTLTNNSYNLEIVTNSCTGILIGVTNVTDGTHEFIFQNPLQLLGGNISTYKIKGKIVDCITGKGIVDVSVSYTNGRFVKTDINGEYEIEAFGDISRTDNLIISNGDSACIKVNCSPNGCDSTFAPISVSSPSCISSNIVTIPDIKMTLTENTTTKGLLTGKYGCGIVLEDCISRETFVQSNDNCYVDIIDMENTSVITFDISQLKVSPKFKALSFYVTENLTYQDWMEWDVDYAILEDPNGMIKDSSGSDITTPTKVRIYIESLLYYTAYSASNTSWQFIQGDMVKIFKTSNGQSVNIEKLVSYREGENYITIDYDSSMKEFVDHSHGAKLRILRPKKYVENELYYQLCTRVKLVNGEVQSSDFTGTLPYSNVFKLQRSVPIYANNTFSSNNVVENVYDTDGKVVGSRTTTKYISVPQNINLVRVSTFNHHSPSDFFGDHCWGKGRISVKNRYENQHYLKTEIALSKGISPEGNTNYLHQFYIEDSQVFNEQQFSSITGVITGQNIILVICNNDYFTLVYDQNEFRSDPKSGQIFAIPSSNRFGKPRTKIGDDFGCQRYDLNTIAYRNGVVTYLDSQRCALVKHNFDEAVDCTPDGLKGWMANKIQYIAKWNKDPHEVGGKIYFHSIVDPNRMHLLLSTAELYQNSTQYLNKDRGINLFKNETFAIDVERKIIKESEFYTPEYYGIIETASLGQQLISFRFGHGWIHYPLPDGVQTFNTYFGEKCKKVYEAIFNLDNTKQKSFLYTEVYCKGQLLYADRVITEAGQESRIMPLWWERRDNFWMADFKCQVNAPADPNLPNQTGVKAIIDGETLYGRWAKVRYVSKDDDDDKYCELTAVVCCFSPI